MIHHDEQNAGDDEELAGFYEGRPLAGDLTYGVLQVATRFAVAPAELLSSERPVLALTLEGPVETVVRKVFPSAPHREGFFLTDIGPRAFLFALSEGGRKNAKRCFLVGVKSVRSSPSHVAPEYIRQRALLSDEVFNQPLGTSTAFTGSPDSAALVVDEQAKDCAVQAILELCAEAPSVLATRWWPERQYLLEICHETLFGVSTTADDVRISSTVGELLRTGVERYVLDAKAALQDDLVLSELRDLPEACQPALSTPFPWQARHAFESQYASHAGQFDHTTQESTSDGISPRALQSALIEFIGPSIATSIAVSLLTNNDRLLLAVLLMWPQDSAYRIASKVASRVDAVNKPFNSAVTADSVRRTATLVGPETVVSLAASALVDHLKLLVDITSGVVNTDDVWEDALVWEPVHRLCNRFAVGFPITAWVGMMFHVVDLGTSVSFLTFLEVYEETLADDGAAEFCVRLCSGLADAAKDPARRSPNEVVSFISSLTRGDEPLH